VVDGHRILQRARLKLTHSTDALRTTLVVSCPKRAKGRPQMLTWLNESDK